MMENKDTSHPYRVWNMPVEESCRLKANAYGFYDYKCDLVKMITDPAGREDEPAEDTEEERDKKLKLLMYAYGKYKDRIYECWKDCRYGRFLEPNRISKYKECPNIPKEYMTEGVPNGNDDLSLELAALRKNFRVMFLFEIKNDKCDIPGYTIKILSMEYSRVMKRFQTLVSFYKVYKEACRLAYAYNRNYTASELCRAFKAVYHSDVE